MTSPTTPTGHAAYLDPLEGRHGRITGYNRGCRCDECKKIKSIRAAESRRRHSTPGQPRSNARGICRVDGCNAVTHGRGWCKKHFRTERQTLPCSAEGCGRTPIVARGWCHRCYYRWKRTGSLGVKCRPPGLTAEAALRFTGWTVTDGGCWTWNGNRSPQGYGFLSFKGARKAAHRLSYSAFKGEIPDGLFVLHHCDNPPCINPDHLHVGDQVDNMRDMDSRGRARRPFGERSGNAKVNTREVREMRALFADGLRPREIAPFYPHTTLRNVQSIVHRHTWKHLP